MVDKSVMQSGRRLFLKINNIFFIFSGDSADKKVEEKKIPVKHK